jgi:hypothetical protein
MSRSAMEVLEEFRKLPLPERREVAQAIVMEANGEGRGRVRRDLNEVLGKFEPLTKSASKDHNTWVAEAVVASKGAGGDGL